MTLGWQPRMQVFTLRRQNCRGHLGREASRREKRPRGPGAQAGFRDQSAFRNSRVSYRASAAVPSANGRDGHTLRAIRAGDKARVNVGATQPCPPDRTIAVGPKDMRAIDRQSPWLARRRDEALINVGAIQPCPPNRPVGRPVKVVAVDRQPDRTNRVNRVTRGTDNKTLSDEALVDLSAIDLSSPDGPATRVRPVHVRPGRSYPIRIARAGDKALLHVGAVEPRASN